MMRLMVVLLLTIILLSNISALCEEGQIDINSATKEELDKITQIGPARAEQIISLRPFSSVDDMIRIVGIGETNINLIKSQGLACVDDEIEEKKNSVNIESEVNVDISINSTSDSNSSSLKEAQLGTINLNPQAIKSEENSEVSGKRNYAVYGLIAFGVLLGLLFLIKKKRYKNEFE